MFDETGCDAITVARGALGNPWIFREIKEYIEKGKVLERPCVEDIIKTMKFHLKLSSDFYGSKRGLSHFKKFFIWYTRSFKGVKLLRGEITRLNTVEGAIDLMSKFKKIGLRDLAPGLYHGLI